MYVCIYVYTLLLSYAASWMRCQDTSDPREIRPEQEKEIIDNLEK